MSTLTRRLTDDRHSDGQLKMVTARGGPLVKFGLVWPASDRQARIKVIGVCQSVCGLNTPNEMITRSALRWISSHIRVLVVRTTCWSFFQFQYKYSANAKLLWCRHCRTAYNRPTLFNNADYWHCRLSQVSAIEWTRRSEMNIAILIMYWIYALFCMRLNDGRWIDQRSWKRTELTCWSLPISLQKQFEQLSDILLLSKTLISKLFTPLCKC